MKNKNEMRVYQDVIGVKMDNNMNRELKRCPFCGEMPRTEVSVSKMGGGEDHVDFTIHCTNCATEKTVRLKIRGFVNFFDVEKAQQQAIQVWNQRMVTE